MSGSTPLGDISVGAGFFGRGSTEEAELGRRSASFIRDAELSSCREPVMNGSNGGRSGNGGSEIRSGTGGRSSRSMEPTPGEGSFGGAPAALEDEGDAPPAARLRGSGCGTGGGGRGGATTTSSRAERGGGAGGGAGSLAVAAWGEGPESAAPSLKSRTAEGFTKMTWPQRLHFILNARPRTLSAAT